LPDQQLAGYRKARGLIQRYIFPGSELASIAKFTSPLHERRSSQPFMSESFRHALCGDVVAVAGAFSSKSGPAVRQLGFDKRFQRMWNFYLGWCEGAFASDTQACALLFAKPETQHAIFGDVFEPGTAAARAASR